MKSRKLLNLALLVALISFGSVVYISPAVAEPATFVVNSVEDFPDEFAGDGICDAGEGVCTLRAAIEEANLNAGADTINFELPSTELNIISPESPLPVIQDALTINGYSQDGAQENTAVSPLPLNGKINIELDGATNDIQASGLVANAENIVIRGLSIYGFVLYVDGSPNGAAIGLGDAANGVVIQGNYINVRADGMTKGSGPLDIGVGGSADNVVFGGSNPEDRNLAFSLSDHNASAAFFTTGTNATVYGNIIGLAKDGVTDLTPQSSDATGFLGPWMNGINLTDSGGNRVGGPNAGQANLIAGNSAQFIFSSNNNIVQGNLIGTDYTGKPNANITNGVGAVSALGENNLLGGTQPGEGNVIAGITGVGVLVGEFDILRGFGLPAPTLNILGNSIYDINIFNYTTVNGEENVFGRSNQGIDLAKLFDTSDPIDFVPDVFDQQGVTPNDEGDTDEGSNNNLNFPVLKTAVQDDNGNLTVEFDLDVSGSPSDQYRVEFFANDISTIFGHGPGQTYLGSVIASEGDDKTVTLDLDDVNVIGKSLSATVTIINADNSSGYGGTSEFAQNISVGSSVDFDSDGSPDAVEQAAPNNGDGNDDSIEDYLQPTITSYVLGDTTTYATFVTEGCSENGSVTSLLESNLIEKDGDLEYPYGLTDFTLNCSRGDTVNITKYIFSDQDVTEMSVRKYRPNESVHFIDVPDATLDNVTVGGSSAIRMQYSLTDGGTLDDDGIANGVIVDPVGIAQVKTSSQSTSNGSNANNNSNVTKAKGSLATTGPQYLVNQFKLSLTLLIVGLVLVGAHSVITSARKRVIYKVRNRM